MEEDVGFFNKVKQALAQKEKEESETAAFEYSTIQSSSHQVKIPDSPRGDGLKLASDVSNSTLTTSASSSMVSHINTNVRTQSPVGRYLVRPRSADYGD